MARPTLLLLLPLCLALGLARAEEPAAAVQAANVSPAAAVAEAAPVSSADDIFQFFEQEAKVVTASKRAQSVREAPANIRVITHEQLRERGVRTLADALVFIPGVQVTKHKSGGEQLWVRGALSAYNDKTLLLIDGHPFKELVYGQHPINEQLPLVDVERIEVVKGPGSSLYGSNAFTGVINIITVDPAKEGAQAEMELEGGNNNTYGANIIAKTRKGGLGVVVSGAYAGTDGPPHDKDNAGLPTQHREPQQLLNANVRAAIAGFTAGVRLTDYSRDYLTYGDKRVETMPTRTALLSLDWDKEINDLLTLSITSYFNWFDWRRVRSDYTNGTNYYLKTLTYSDEKTLGHGVTLQGEWHLPAQNLLLTSVDYEVEGAYSLFRTAYNTTIANPPPAIVRWGSPANPLAQRYSAALEDTWSATEWLRITAGYRYDNDIRFEAQHNIRAAVVLTPNEELSLKLLYGTAYRAPSFRETVVVESPASGIDGGNPNLKPEHIETSEAIVNWTLHHGLQLQVAGYRNIVTGLIAPDAIAAGGIGLYNNKGIYTTYGVEPELAWKPIKQVDIYANYTRQQAVDERGDKIGNVAEEMMNAGLGVHLPWHFQAHIDWHRTGERNRPPEYQTAIAAALRSDLTGLYDRTDIALGTEGLPVDAQIILHNAFDMPAYDPDFTEGRNDLQWAGRTIYGQLRMSL